MAPLILIAEDNPEIRGLLRLYLEGEGLRVLEAENGDEALAKARAETPDLAILDVMMPGLSGYEVTRALRRFSEMPILILSAKSEDNDKILGLNLGADDYVTKPFSLAVLRARVSNLLRRSARPQAAFTDPPFVFDFARMQFFRDGAPVELSRTEQRLLRLLTENRGHTLTREQLLEKVWDGGEFVDENALSVAVKRLRDKLTDAPIKTVYGLGYTWEVR